MNILVVDDEFYTCELLAEKIRSFGLREIEAVLCAGSGKEALRILEKTDCQLLITDICMSPMDGLELISKAKDRGVSSINRPVISISLLATQVLSSEAETCVSGPGKRSELFLLRP